MQPGDVGAGVTEHLLPGRWTEARHPNRKELNATLVLALPLDETSVKISDGPPSEQLRIGSTG